MEQGDYAGVTEICDRILAMDPNNADVMKDKAYALDAAGDIERSLNEYRNALRTKQNQALFEDVLLKLVKRGRYDELESLCVEFSGSYDSSAMMWRLKGNAEYASGRYKEAMDSFGKAAELSPYEPQIWHSRGMAAEMVGQLKRAEEAFDKALLLDLDSKEFWLSRAVILEKRGNLKGAVHALNRVISESPDSVFALVRKSMILVRTEKYDEAIFFMDLALRINSRDIAVHRMKMDVLKHLSRHEQIIRAADDLLLADTTDVQALTDKTRSHLALEENQKAVTAADRALRIDPDQPDILRMKKTALRHLKDHAGVAEVCRRILVSEPDNRTLRMELAAALADGGDRKGAMDVYNKLSAEDPLDLKVIAMKSKLSSNMGEGSMTAELIQEVLDNRPKDPETLTILADVMIRAGYSDDALRVLDTAMKLDPGDTGNYKLKAQVLMKEKNYEEAQKVLMAALKADMDDAQIWWYLGETQEVRREMHQALLSYDSAMKLGMDIPELYFRRGIVQESLGMDDAAVNSYSIAAVRDPMNAKVLVKIAELQTKMNRMNAAEQNLDAALDIDPDLPEALFALAKIYVAKGETGDASELYRRFIGTGAESSIAEEFCDLVGADIMTVPSKRLAESERRFRDEIEMYSHKILEHCYNTGYAITDKETFAGAGVPEGMRNDILRYLGSIDMYGDIDMSSKEFARMEALSRELIMNDRITRIESEPLVSLSSAYMASGAKSIDEAKELIAYIYKVMTEKIEEDVHSDEVTRIADELSSSTGDVTVFGVIEAFDVGICCARTAKALSAKMSGQTFHV
jgi:tetratricopeptide (TPR) repeat protein